MKKTTYIQTLSQTEQDYIYCKLKESGLSDNDIERAMNSRLCDLGISMAVITQKDNKIKIAKIY